MKILIIQSANMEALGQRDPELYGTITAKELDAALKKQHPEDEFDIRYSNIEGEAINWIYEAGKNGTQGLLMNPAGFLHAGYALRDCLQISKLPYVEVHMTNIDRRGFKSVTAEEADGMVTGMGAESYVLGIAALRMLVED